MTRRELLKLMTRMGAAAVGVEAVMNMANRGALLAQYAALETSVFRHFQRRFETGPRVAVVRPQWLSKAEGTGREGNPSIVDDIGENFSTFFINPDRWAEYLDTTFRIFGLSPQLALPVYRHWSKSKTGTFKKQMSEKAVALVQTHLSTVASIPGIRTVLTRSGVPGKAMINSRTYGFYDKGSTVYARGIIHSMEKQQTAPEFWNKLARDSSFVSICQRHLDLRSRVDAIKQNSTVVDTDFDGELISTAQDLERILIDRNHEMPLQLALTSACIARQQDLWRASNPDFDTYPPDVQSFLLLTNSDFYPYKFPENFNPKTEFDFFPPEPVTKSASEIIHNIRTEDVVQGTTFINNFLVETDRNYPDTGALAFLNEYKLSAQIAPLL